MDLSVIQRLGKVNQFVFRVDSRNRNRFVYPEPESFQVVLDTPLRNVVGMEVLDGQIPKTEYTVDKFRDTIAYRFTDIDPAGTWRSDIMPHGNYSDNVFFNYFNSFSELTTPRLLLDRTHPQEPRARFYSTDSFQVNFDPSLTTLSVVLGGNKPVKGTIYSRTSLLDDTEPYVYQSVYVTSRSRWEIDCPGIMDFGPVKFIHLRSEEIEQHVVGNATQRQFQSGLATFELPVDGFNQTRLDFVNVPYRPVHMIEKLSQFSLRLVHPDGRLYDCKGIDFVIQFAVHWTEMKLTPEMLRDMDAGVVPMSLSRTTEVPVSVQSSPVTSATKPKKRFRDADAFVSASPKKTSLPSQTTTLPFLRPKVLPTVRQPDADEYFVRPSKPPIRRSRHTWPTIQDAFAVKPFS